MVGAVGLAANRAAEERLVRPIVLPEFLRGVSRCVCLCTCGDVYMATTKYRVWTLQRFSSLFNPID